MIHWVESCVSKARPLGNIDPEKKGLTGNCKRKTKNIFEHDNTDLFTIFLILIISWVLLIACQSRSLVLRHTVATEYTLLDKLVQVCIQPREITAEAAVRKLLPLLEHNPRHFLADVCKMVEMMRIGGVKSYIYPKRLLTKQQC